MLSSLQRFQGLPFQLPQAQVAHLQSHNLGCSGEITRDFPGCHTSMRQCYLSVYDDMGTIKSMVSIQKLAPRLTMPKSEKEHQVCCLHRLKSHQTFHSFRQAVRCSAKWTLWFLGTFVESFFVPFSFNSFNHNFHPKRLKCMALGYQLWHVHATVSSLVVHLTWSCPTQRTEEAALMRTLQNGRTCNGLHGRDRILLFHHGFYNLLFFLEGMQEEGGENQIHRPNVCQNGLTLRNLHAQTFAMGQKQTICRHVPWRPTQPCR